MQIVVLMSSTPIPNKASRVDRRRTARYTPPMPSQLPLRVLLTLSILTLLAGQSLAAPKDLIPLTDLAARYRFPPASITPSTLQWRNPYATLSFQTGSRRLTFNNRIFWLNGAVTGNGKQWCISRADADGVIAPLLHARNTLKHQGYSLVILDPGHGGSDPGTIGPRRLYEKKVVLDIAKRVRRKLNASNVAVRMTRRRDKTLTLQDRPKLATSWGADAFVSIHANSAASKMASGIETFVMPVTGFPSTTSSKPDNRCYAGNKNDAANTVLGGLVQQGVLAKTGAPDRGVKRGRFAVLRAVNCPAALVEVGFLSNPKEASQLATAAYRDRVAEGIAQGILTYLVRTESSQRP
jgi:N-acetylmuramoyl-L-alanine amidase